MNDGRSKEPISNTKMAMPPNSNLPFFAYGAFMPGELAFRQIEAYLLEAAKELRIPGALLIRDGLPLYDPHGQAGVEGFLLSFTQDDAERAYQTICDFEPPKEYNWASLGSSNVFKGRKLSKGVNLWDGGRWSFREDPVFCLGLKAIEDASETFGRPEFGGSPPNSFEWDRYFKLQMAYLLLWSAIERFAAFAFGPSLTPSEKIKKLAEDQAFLEAVRSVVKREHRLFSSQDPDHALVLTKGRPEKAPAYYYQVRNNLSPKRKMFLTW